MRPRRVLSIGAGAAGLAGALGGAWILSLPPAPPQRTMPAIAKDEADAILAT
jgi:hypothetical protein